MDKSKNVLKKLLVIHGLITFAASILLIVAPTLIPETVNIEISPNQYLLCYFLGAAELSIAFLSFFGRTIDDKKSLRLISSSFVLFHLATAALEIVAFSNGLTSKILFNVILRIIISVLFGYFGIYKMNQNNAQETKR